jgi:hypothetical protein
MMIFFYSILAVVASIAKPVVAGEIVKNNEYIPAPYVVLADQIQADMAKRLSQRYNMRVVGMGGGLANRVNMLGLSFQIQGALTKEQLRKILIDCEETFLATINENEQIRPFLKNFPFTPKEIEIEIFLVDRTGREVFHPDISTAVAKHGELTYSTVDRNNTFVYKDEEVEAYGEALKLVRNGCAGEKPKSTCQAEEGKGVDTD